MRSAIRLFCLLAVLVPCFAFAQTPLYFYTTKPADSPLKKDIKAPVDERIDWYVGIQLRPAFTAMGHARWLRDYIQNKLKPELVTFLQSPEWEGLKDSVQHGWRGLAEIPVADLIQDIQDPKTEYQPHVRCYSGTVDEKDSREKEKKEGSGLYQKATPICFSPALILHHLDQWQEQYVIARLLGLALHEELHHFGYEDRDNSMYRSFMAQANTWLMRDLPPVQSVLVSDRFRQLRNDFREAASDGSVQEIDLPKYTCEKPEYLVSLNAVKEREDFQAFEKWLQSPLYLKPSLADPERFKVVPPVQPETGITYPRFLYKTGEMSPAQFFQFESFRIGGSAISVFVASASPEKVILEITGSVPGLHEKLPSTNIYDETVLGYTKCTLSATSN